jgi:hypothetical protein
MAARLATGLAGRTYHTSFNTMAYSYEVSTSFYTIMQEDARALSDRRLYETILQKSMTPSADKVPLSG